ncbi:MAG: Probable phosphoglycerate mutase 2(), partial [uncultured Acetobacteraceae bacterium]
GGGAAPPARPVLVSPPRGDGLERARPVAGPHRHPAERGGVGAGQARGADPGWQRHRHGRRLAAVPRAGDGGDRGRGARPARLLRRRPARGELRRAGRPADGRLVRRLDRRHLHARTRRILPRPAGPRRFGGEPRPFAAGAGARGGARRAVPRPPPVLRLGAERPHAQRPARPLRTARGGRGRLDPHAGATGAGI